MRASSNFLAVFPNLSLPACGLDLAFFRKGAAGYLPKSTVTIPNIEPLHTFYPSTLGP